MGMVGYHKIKGSCYNSKAIKFKSFIIGAAHIVEVIKCYKESLMGAG